MSVRNHTTLAAVLILVCLSAVAAIAGNPVSADIDRDVWSVVSRTVVEKDIEGMAAVYHPDAVLVGTSGTTSIAGPLEKWGKDMEAASEAGTRETVSFRFTSRQDGETTAFEMGLFRYTITDASGDETSFVIPFETLLVKREGRWLILMERQLPAVDEAVWVALE